MESFPVRVPDEIRAFFALNQKAYVTLDWIEQCGTGMAANGQGWGIDPVAMVTVGLSARRYTSRFQDARQTCCRDINGRGHWSSSVGVMRETGLIDPP